MTCAISEVDIDLIGQYLEEIDLFQRHKQEKLTQMCQNEFPKEFENLQTIPGVKERSAASILAEIGADMKMFSASSLVSWCGFKPRNEESVGEIKSRRIRMVINIFER